MAQHVDVFKEKIDQAEALLDRAIGEDWPDEEIDNAERMVNASWKRLRAEFPDHFEAKFRTAYPEEGGTL